MNKKVEEIKKIVQKRLEDTDWNYHILPVVRYAKKLAKIYKVDGEIVELAALLHDIGRNNVGKDISQEDKHHIVGANEAVKILQKYKYPEKTILEIKHCIEAHRTLKGPKSKTLTAKIIANADAMAHFDSLPIFFYWRAIQRKDKFEDIVKWVGDKIERDWKMKITLPEAKKLVEKKYKAIKLLLSSIEIS
ncbi:MAG: HD domain-containing protein [Candidatus Pacebacteria bacterium]|nr:HD domain-containing protein [Candidatus Paceibacterota bacterium]